MCNRLGLRKYKEAYGVEYKTRAEFLASIEPREKGYLWNISMTRTGFDFHGECYIEYKPGSAKHKHAIKLELYEDRALALFYSEQAWKGNHRKNELKKRK